MLKKKDLLYWLILGRAPKRFKVVRSKKNNLADRNRYQKNKSEARALVAEKLLKYNKFYNFKYNRVSIRDQKTRWGSCSKKGNLNFNYKLMFLPEELADYIIVHELCHLKEFNHSSHFWAEVSRVFPNHLKLRADLRKTKINFKQAEIL